VLVAMFVVLAGLVLEATLGERFLMTRARDYRAWAWGALPALFLAALILMWLLSQRSDDFKRRFPTGWVRVAFALPLTGAMLAAALVAAPPGWIALGGWLVGERVHDVPARVVEVHGPKDRGRGCRHDARIATEGNDARLCIRGLVVGDNPAAGDAVVLAGRASAAGLYVERIERARR
jgi:hypothetical protein